MAESAGAGAQDHGVITKDDVRRILGDVDDAVVHDLLHAEISANDLEHAYEWATGQNEVIDVDRRPLEGKAAVAYDILMASPAFQTDDAESD